MCVVARDGHSHKRELTHMTRPTDPAAHIFMRRFEDSDRQGGEKSDKPLKLSSIFNFWEILSMLQTVMIFS